MTPKQQSFSSESQTKDAREHSSFSQVGCVCHARARLSLFTIGRVARFYTPVSCS